METRAITAIALSMLVLFGFQYFFVETQPVDTGNATNTTIASEAESVPGSKNEAGSDSLSLPAATNTLPATIAVSDIVRADGNARDIVIETDLYHAVISEHGGAFKTFKLKKYRDSLKKDAEYVDLVKVTPPALPGVMAITGQNGMIDLSGALFKADREGVNLQDKGPDGRETLHLTASLNSGGSITKTLVIKNGTYWMDFSVQAHGFLPSNASFILYDKPFNDVSRYIFSGPSYMSNGNLEEVTLKEPGESSSFTGPVDWMSYGDNYFMNAVIPLESRDAWQLDFRQLDTSGLVESRLTTFKPVTGKNIMDAGLYFGPKEIDRLNGLGHNLAGVINFGWFDIIAKPVLYLLKFIYKYIGNYGIAIILVTVSIKLLFWPLAQKSARSMKIMQKLQPKMKKLKDKYGDDKEKLNKEMMQLYRTYNVNPMSGCMPMLIQIPVFFALYKVLLQSIELRHAPFMLWINDLSAPDRLMIPGVDIPYLDGIPVLTLLMGVSMYLQQKLSPSSLDPAQAKMMQFLPIIFTFMFLSFPSGLVLYWFVNNILSIAQQYYVNKYTD
jgi:YidC/Oxa1 family membrane protein insertase